MARRKENGFDMDSLLQDLISEASTSVDYKGSMPVCEFAEQIIFNGKAELFKPQKAILKAFYSEPLDEEERAILTSWKLDLPFQDDPHGRTNWVEDNPYRSLSLEAGRGGCPSENSWAVTTEGTLTYGELRDRRSQGEEIGILTVDPVTWEVKTTYDIKTWDRGYEPSIRIKTKAGKEEVCTTDHPYLVWRKGLPEWIKLEDIMVGDKIAVLDYLPIFGQSSIGQDKAKLLGYLLGDGGISGKSSVNFTNADERIIKDIENSLQKTFKEVSIKKVSDIQYRLTTKKGQTNPLLDWLREIGEQGKKAIHKRIPNCIKQAPKDEVALFLSRLFACDGYASIDKPRDRHPNGKSIIGICLASKDFIEDIQRELIKFGISSRVRYKPSKYNGKTFDAWCLTISERNSMLLFIKEIGIFSKESKLNSIESIVRSIESQPATECLPLSVWERINSKQTKLGLSNREVTGGSDGDNKRLRKNYGPTKNKALVYASNLKDKELQSICNSNLRWDTVLEVEDAGLNRIVGIEVTGTHTIANSIVSHNSKSSLGSIFALYEFYKLISMPNPGRHYGLLPNDPIAIFVIAQTLEQVKDTLFAKIRGYAKDSTFFKSLEDAGKIEILSESIRYPAKNVAIYAKHTNSPALVGYTLKAMILDEFSRFENKVEDDGSIKSLGDHLWENVGKGCISYGKKIETSIGSIKVEDLLERFNKKENISVNTINPLTLETYLTPNIDVWDNGTQEVYKVKVKSGKEEVVTEEHPFLVWKDEWMEPQWVEAKDVLVSDYVACLSKLPTLNKSSITKEQAWLLGAMVGDGSMNTRRALGFTNTDPVIIERFREYLEKEFYPCTLEASDKNRSYQYRVRANLMGGGNKTNRFANWLEEIEVIGHTAHTKRIPSIISSGNLEQIGSFLNGLYSADGFIINHKKYGKIEIGISLCNEALVQDIQRELLRFGIYSRYRKKHTSPSEIVKKECTCYYLEISDAISIIQFYELIGITGDRTAELEEVYKVALGRNKNLSKADINLYPVGVLNRLQSIKKNNQLSYSQLNIDAHTFSAKRRPSRDIILRFLSKGKDDLLSSMMSSSIVWERVISNEMIGKEPTVGIEIKDTGVIGNPIISHNTNRFGAEGYRMAISSAWETGDPMERLWGTAQLDPQVLAFRLRTWDVNKLKSVSRESCNTDYIKDREKAELEFEGIRRKNKSNFISGQMLEDCNKGRSCFSSKEILFTVGSGDDRRNYVGNELIHIDNSDLESNSYIHIDFSIKRDATALAVVSAREVGFGDEKKWVICVDGLLRWRPRIDNFGRQRFVSYQNVEDIIIQICSSRKVSKVTFDQFNSESTIQRLHGLGISTEKLSSSRNAQLDYYTLFRDLCTDNLLWLPADSDYITELSDELTGIIIKPNGQIIHGPAGKDLSDSVVNAVFSCYLNLVKSGLIHHISIEISTVASQLKNKIQASSVNKKITAGKAIDRLYRKIKIK